MFTTVEDVAELTGYDVTKETVVQAQSLVEAYIGRVEADIVNPTDTELLTKAVAYQCAYMSGDASIVFEQVSAGQIMQFGNMITFRQNDDASPWIAPLAILACKKLSWKRSRSVRTGSIYYNPPSRSGWRYE